MRSAPNRRPEMRRALILAALMAATPAAAAAPATYANPILHADYSDPDVIRVGRDYYLVASSFHFSPGIPILHSRDLVHWRIVGHVLPRLPFGPAYDLNGPQTLTDAISRPVGPNARHAGGVWAPAIRHHEGLFYVYWPTPDEGIFMATARRPEGPWSAPVAVIARPGLEDPCPFWDEDGQAWLIHGRVGAGPLILHRMSADGRRVLDEGETIAEDPVNLPVLEGPKLYRRNGYYYIFAPIGGVERGSQAVGRARNIRGPYQWRVVLEPGTTAIQGPHQGGWVETPSGQGWFLHFNSSGAFGRIVHMQPLRWIDDWPVIGEPIAGRTSGQPVARHATPDTGSPPTADRLQDSDEFSSPRLGLQWSWNHNPVAGAWSLTRRPGWLRLAALPSEHLVTAHDTLTQILQGPRSRITARIDVAHMVEGQRAGLAMFGVRPGWIGIVRSSGRNTITLGSAGVETPRPALTGPIVELRVEVTADQNASYAYSVDGGRSFRSLGEPIPLARFSWWKGSRPALFSYVHAPAGAAAPRGWIDVDWFRVERPGG